MRSFILSFLLVSFVVTSTASASAPLCESLLNENIVHELEPARSSEKNLKVVRVSHLQEVLNQGRRGFCWLYGTYTNLINRVLQRTGKDPQISLFYWSYYHWMGRAVGTALNPMASANGGGTGVPEGGNMDLALDLIRQYGAITNQEWEQLGGSTTIQLPENDVKEIPQLSGLIARFHAQKFALLRWLKPNVSPSAGPQAIENYYAQLFSDRNLEVVLDQYFVEQQKEIAQGQPSAFTSGQLKALRQLVSAKQIPSNVMTRSQIDQVIQGFDQGTVRRMVRFFNHIYFGTDTSPLEKGVDLIAARARAAKLFPEIAEPSVNFILTMDRKQKPTVQAEQGSLQVLVSIDQAILLTSRLIQNNVPVVVSYDHQKNYVVVTDPVQPENSGVMSVRRFAEYPEKSYVNRRLRRVPLSGYLRGGHLVDATGVLLNPKATPAQVQQGKDVVAIEIKNSWGPDVGQKGFFQMDRDYFGAFVDVVSVFDSDIKKPEFAQILGADVIAQIQAFRQGLQKP